MNGCSSLKRGRWTRNAKRHSVLLVQFAEKRVNLCACGNVLCGTDGG